MDPYLAWLGRNETLYPGYGTFWRRYQNALVPAPVKPAPTLMTSLQAEELLGKSGASFVRYFSKTLDHPSEFWYAACRKYSYEDRSPDTRRQIRKALDACLVRIVDCQWLAEYGYDCYLSAFHRYQHALPESRQAFKARCLQASSGPFQVWVVFVNGQLVAFERCVVGDDYVACLVLKAHPAFLRFRPIYALFHTLLRTYVEEQGKTLYAGFRSIAHRTNIHDFMQRFGIERVYCDLCVVYRRSLRATVKMFYPLKPILDRIPSQRIPGASFVWKAQTLLNQEKMLRSFSQAEPRLRR
jgi:hypothetical protein